MLHFQTVRAFVVFNLFKSNITRLGFTGKMCNAIATAQDTGSARTGQPGIDPIIQATIQIHIWSMRQRIQAIINETGDVAI